MSALVKRGRVWKFGNNVDIEYICMTKYFALDYADLGQHCFETLRPEFGQLARPGDLIVAGKAFGGGAGHDHCNLALTSAGVGGIVAESFGSQFYRHSVAHAIPMLECAEAQYRIAEGDEIEVDFVSGTITNLQTGETIHGTPARGSALEIVQAGGLIPFLRQEMAKAGPSGGAGSVGGGAK